MNRTKKGSLLVLFSAIAFGIIPIMAELAYNQGANAVTVLAFRFLIASVMFLIYLALKRKNIKVSMRNLLGLLIFGTLSYGTQCLLFFSAFKYISPSIGELLYHIYPVFIVFGAYFVLKEKITIIKVISIILSLIGCVLVLWAPWDKLLIKGIVLIILSAIMNTIYTIGNKKILVDVEPIIVTTYVAIGCSIFLFTYGGITGTITFNLSPTLICIIAMLAFCSTVLGIFSFLTGLSMIGATKASVIATFEPVVTVVLSYFFLNENISIVQLLGGILIIISIIVMEKYDNESVPEINKNLNID